MNATETEIQIIATEVLTPRVDGSTGVTAMLKHEVRSLVTFTEGGFPRLGRLPSVETY